MGRVSGEAKGHGDESCQVRLEEQAIGDIERWWRICFAPPISICEIESTGVAERTVSRKEIPIPAFDGERHGDCHHLS